MDHTEAYKQKESVLKSVTQSGLLLQHASEELRADEEVVLSAVRQNGLALQFASEDLRAARGVVLEAVRQHGGSLLFASEALRADKGLVSEAVRQGGQWLVYASQELRADEDVVLEAVSQSKDALEFAAPALRAERRIVLRAVQHNGFALAHASEELKADKNIVLEAVQRHDGALRFASLELAADREVVSEAVRQWAEAILFASRELQEDKDLILLAARNANCRQRMMLIPIHKAGLSESGFFQVANSAIAVRGEQGAPTVSATLRLERSREDSQHESFDFVCEIVLMSGSSFVCRLPGGPAGSASRLRRLDGRSSSLVLDDLADEIVRGLQAYTEVGHVRRVFINFSTSGEDGDAIPVTPWDGNRQLFDFLQGDVSDYL